MYNLFFMKRVILSLSLLLFCAWSCSTSKNAATDEDIKALKDLVDSKAFTIESDWANPQVTSATQQVLNSGILEPGSNAGGINLIGNSNFLTISGDSIKSYLPYFGERQMNVGYGGEDNAIQLDGLLENYSVEEKKNNSYLIRFNAKSNSESFQVYITLFSNMNSDIRINSNTRFSIGYRGMVEPIQNE